MSLLFQDFPKIARFSRDIVITEKLDGTNAQILLAEANVDNLFELDTAGLRPHVIHTEDFLLFAAGRNGYLPNNGQDSFGFHQWVRENADELVKLGPGRHFGEWWGKGIQRNYGLDHRKFSLFNTSRWGDGAVRPACCDVVPVLYEGMFNADAVTLALENLITTGSKAAPGFMRPEGIIVYHTAADIYFKKTILKDEVPKGLLK